MRADVGHPAKGENEDRDAPAPRIRNREDYEAALEQRKRKGPIAALPGKTRPQ